MIKMFEMCNNLSVDKTPAGVPIKFGQRFAIMTIDEKVKNKKRSKILNVYEELYS